MYNSIFRLFLIFILVLSGGLKIIDCSKMIEILQLLIWFPDRLVIITSTLFPIFELSLAFFMIIGYQRKLTSILCTGLFLFFFLFSVYGTIIGIEQECGCFGNLIKSYFDWKMILRNFIFFMLSSYLTYYNLKSRSLKEAVEC